VHGERSVTADTGLRLSRYFGTTERFWLNLQTRFDLEVEKDRLGDRLEDEVLSLSSSSKAPSNQALEWTPPARSEESPPAWAHQPASVQH